MTALTYNDHTFYKGNEILGSKVHQGQRTLAKRRETSPVKNSVIRISNSFGVIDVKNIWKELNNNNAVTAPIIPLIKIRDWQALIETLRENFNLKYPELASLLNTTTHVIKNIAHNRNKPNRDIEYRLEHFERLMTIIWEGKGSRSKFYAISKVQTPLPHFGEESAFDYIKNNSADPNAIRDVIAVFKRSA